MAERKGLLEDTLGIQIPGTATTVGEAAGKAGQLARDNPLATGALAALLLGTRGGRSLAGSVVKMGALAAVAGLAYQAYRNYRNGAAPQREPAGGPVLLPPPEDTAFSEAQLPADFGTTLMRAMIAAARADGVVDAAERAAILGRLRASGAGEEAEAKLEAELDHKSTIADLVAAVRSDAEKLELYTASRLAVDAESEAERAHLAALAAGLGLPEGLVRHVEATVAGAVLPNPSPSA